MKTENEERKPAVILVCTAKGDRNAARRLIGDAIRKTLKIKKFGTDPYFIAYRKEGEDAMFGIKSQARYLLYVTETEWKAINDRIHSEAKKAGWSKAPTDGYKD